MSVAIVPRPVKLVETGTEYQLIPAARIIAIGKDVLPAAELLAEYLRPATGFGLPVLSETEPAPGDIVLESKGNNIKNDSGFVQEKYQLSVSKDQILLKGENAASLVRGMQTLRQLFPPAVYAPQKQECRWTIPGIEIEDQPQFRWRGMMLDIARHFFDKTQICRMIELFAQHKFNVVHLHLTDDQGWRIEIKKYPRLTEFGSVRSQTLVGHDCDRPRSYDGKPYGGFLTQDDLREIICFAEKRHIMLVPEIDMPGHMCAAIAAYPELGNFPKNKIDVRDCWGISYQILAPRVQTMNFLKDVLTELFDIFPGRFFHIGGDEARKIEWEICAEIQQLMKEHDCADEGKLQHWFTAEIQKFVAQHGRKLIGWDEIAECPEKLDAAIMCRLGEKAILDFISRGHELVIATNTHCYFDKYQADPKYEPQAIGGFIPLNLVYSYRAIPDSLPSEKHPLILGGQAQLWSEYIPTPEHLEYMAFPRACALSEKLWTPESLCRYLDFTQRLGIHTHRLTVQNVHFAPYIR